MALKMLGFSFVLIFFAPPASGYFYSVSFYGDSSFTKIFNEGSFGFDTGGTLSLDLICDAPVQNIGVFQGSRSHIVSLSDLRQCSRKDTPMITIGTNLTSYANYSVTFTMDKGFYSYMIASLCDTSNPHYTQLNPCTARLVLLNPGGEQLSSDQIAIPRIMVVFIWIWAVALGLWTVNSFWRYRFTNRLQLFVTCGAVVKYASVILTHEKYVTLSEDGELHHSLSNWIDFVGWCENALLFSILISISYGWRTIKPHFESDAIVNAIVCPLLFFGTQVLAARVHYYFSALSIIIVVIMTIAVLRLTEANVRFLNLKYIEFTQAHRGRQQDLQRLAPLIGKRRLLLATKYVFYYFVVVWVLLEILSVYFEEKRWLELTLSETLEASIYFVILWFFRLRDFSKYCPQDDGTELKERAKFVLFESPNSKECGPYIGAPVKLQLFQTYTRSIGEQYMQSRRHLEAASPSSPLPSPLQEQNHPENETNNNDENETNNNDENDNYNNDENDNYNNDENDDDNDNNNNNNNNNEGDHVVVHIHRQSNNQFIVM